MQQVEIGEVKIRFPTRKNADGLEFLIEELRSTGLRISHEAMAMDSIGAKGALIAFIVYAAPHLIDGVFDIIKKYAEQHQIYAEVEVTRDSFKAKASSVKELEEIWEKMGRNGKFACPK